MSGPARGQRRAARAGADGRAPGRRNPQVEAWAVRQPATDVVALGRVDATGVGRLLAASATADVVDAHVVVCARRAGQAVVTTDPDDLYHLDPSLILVGV